MSTQRFCLRWNNHQSNLLSVFDQLLHDESFVDVTLAVDGRYLKAHKIVLSACSPYFQALFVGHPDRHPIVILKDIPYVDMRSLLDFMYRGEVSVDQDRLTTFLKVAESLRIKGLTEVNEDQCDLPKMASSLLTTPHPLSAGSMSLSYQQRLKRPLSSSQHSLNSSSLQTNNPLLGSALTGPKRKRALPRKLSGSLAASLDLLPQPEDRLQERIEARSPSTDSTPGERKADASPSRFLGRESGDSSRFLAREGGDASAFLGREAEEEDDEDEEFDEEDQRSGVSDSEMIERTDSPFDNKMLEVNVSEGKPPLRPSSGASASSGPPPEERGEEGRSPSPEGGEGREDEGDSNVEGAGELTPLNASQELAVNVKKERETSDTPSGGDQSDRNSSPTPERFPPGLLRLIPRSELVSKDKLLENSALFTNKNHKANGHNANHFDNLLKSLIMNNNVEEGGGNGHLEENRKQILAQFSNEHKFILSQLEQFQKNNNGNFSLHAQSQHIHQMLTNNNHASNGGMNENHNFMTPTPERNALAVKRRIRRRATSSSDPTESLTEMSVRGLNLFRYASVTEGIYKCMECAKVDVIKTFKNKYSFQRHAFLYHEGCQRKVFPCPICGKEFSRPDKMKNHMKTVHDCFMPATTPQRGHRASPLVIDFHKDGMFNKDIVHNLSIFATNNNAGGGPGSNAPSTAALPLVPFYLPP